MVFYGSPSRVGEAKFLRITMAESVERVVETRTAWSVVVVYEDTMTRELAVKFCDHLVERFWTTDEFEVSWLSFADLQEARPAHEAKQKAAVANLIIFATWPETSMPVEIRGWIENWVSQRGDREGALFGLLDHASGLTGRTAEKYVYLRAVAHRAGMDYLTEVPQNLLRSMPDSLESYTERADRVTSVLDEILRQQEPPHPWS